MKTIILLFIGLVLSMAIYAQEIPKLKKENGKYALLNQDNKVVSDYYSAIYDFQAGITIVRNYTKFGAINKQGKVVIPVEYNQYQIKDKYNNYLKNYIAENPDDKEVVEYLRQAEEQKKIANLKDKADEYYENEEYSKAIPVYKELLQLSAGDFDIYDKIGRSYYATNNNDSAVVYFEKALAIEEDINLFYRSDYAFANIGEYQKSLDAFDQLGANYQEYINQGKANTYHKLGEYKKAYELMKENVKEYPDDYNNYFNLSFYALFVKKPQKAISAAKKSLELAPEKTGVYTNLALGYVLNNKFNKAKPIYLEWKDKHFPNDERLAKEVFLQDIADLEAAGIKHKNFKKVRELLK